MLTLAEREEYRKIGSAFGCFPDTVALSALPVTGDEIVEYALQSLRSGLKVMSLTELEQAALRDTFGDEWEARVTTDGLNRSDEALVKHDANVPPDLHDSADRGPLPGLADGGGQLSCLS